MRLVITFMVLLTTFSLVNAQNIIQNGGFENNDHFEFWTANVTVTGASVEPVDSLWHTGSWSVEIKSGTIPVGGWTQLMQTLLTPLNNIEYKLTVWIKDSVTTDNFIGVYGLSAGDEVALGIDSSNNSAIVDPDSGRIKITQDFFQNWTRINYFFNSGENYTGYLLRIEEASSGNSLTLHLDDFACSPVPGQPTIQVSAPNGGEEWFVNSQQNVTWTSSNVTNVKIDYSTNDGGLWLNVVSSVPADSGSYSWIIPNTPSTECLVRISDANFASRFDISDSVFTISPILTVTSPNGGEDWIIGEEENITWTSLNILDVSIEYSTDNGDNWISVIASTPASAGSYNWTVPSTPSTQCLVRISDAANASINDVSDLTFAISLPPNPMVTVTVPNGGESWIVGTLRQIRWTSQDIDSVKIEYSTDNGNAWIVVIQSRLASVGSVPWIIPNTPSMQCLVRISDVDSALIYDVSDDIFTIQNPVSVEDINSGIPEEYNLYQCYPNPFNPSTTIKFALPEAANVTLTIYNTLGQKVEVLVNSELEAGRYSYEWNAKNVTTGVYIYEIRTDKFVAIKKMLLVK